MEIFSYNSKAQLEALRHSRNPTRSFERKAEHKNDEPINEAHNHKCRRCEQRQGHIHTKDQRHSATDSEASHADLQQSTLEPLRTAKGRVSIPTKISRYLQLALTSTEASDIHPSACLRNNSLVIPAVPRRKFEEIQSALPLAIQHGVVRLEYFSKAKRRRKGTLILSMPTRVHELLKGFTLQIKDQLVAGNLLPESWTAEDLQLEERGSVSLELELNNQQFTFQPDACLALSDLQFPFLVLEVAVTQIALDAKKKAQNYILGSKGKIVFALVVKITKGRGVTEPEVESVGTESSQEMGHSETGQREVENILSLPTPPPLLADDSMQLSSSISKLSSAPSDLQSRYIPTPSTTGSVSPPTLPLFASSVPVVVSRFDTVHISILKKDYNNDLSHPVLTVQWLLEDIEVFPQPDARACSFTINWSDIIQSDEHGSPVTISLHGLEDLVRTALDKDVIDVDGTTRSDNEQILPRPRAPSVPPNTQILPIFGDSSTEVFSGSTGTLDGQSSDAWDSPKGKQGAEAESGRRVTRSSVAVSSMEI